jgi:hypothetical protein
VCTLQLGAILLLLLRWILLHATLQLAIKLGESKWLLLLLLLLSGMGKWRLGLVLLLGGQPMLILLIPLHGSHLGCHTCLLLGLRLGGLLGELLAIRLLVVCNLLLRAHTKSVLLELVQVL